ncbi:class C sortase [Glutamicibacter creatinolyticus]
MRRRWRPRWPLLIPATIAWLGLLIFMYPSTASWVSQYNQSQLIGSYSAQVEEGLDPAAPQQLEQARKYNEALNSGALLGANTNLPTGEGTSDDESLDYWSMLRAKGADVMARLRIPAIDVDLPIYHGTSDATLDMGVGHLEGTSLPVGGAGTHSVLTAHRGLAHATMFSNLDQVKVGDTFSIEVLGEVLTYRVANTTVVDPDQTESLRQAPGKDLVTLVTCTPLGINTQRILVTAERMLPTPQEDLDALGQRPDIPGFPWWTLVIGGGTLTAGTFIWSSGRVQPARRGGSQPN